MEVINGVNSSCSQFWSLEWHEKNQRTAVHGGGFFWLAGSDNTTGWTDERDFGKLGSTQRSHLVLFG